MEPIAGVAIQEAVAAANTSSSTNVGEAKAAGEALEKRRKVLAASLLYLRARVGVPRDMPFPAARQFRAHLTWMARHLDSNAHTGL